MHCVGQSEKEKFDEKTGTKIYPGNVLDMQVPFTDKNVTLFELYLRNKPVFVYCDFFVATTY